MPKNIFTLFILIASTIPCHGAQISTLSDFYNFLLQRKSDRKSNIQKTLARIHKSNLTDRVLGEVVKFYEQRNFEPFWFVEGRLSLRGSYALEALKNAESEGLNPLNYAQALGLFPQKKRQKKGKPQKSLPPVKGEKDEALREIYFCTCVFRYMIDVTGGRIPHTLMMPITTEKTIHKSPADVTLTMNERDETGEWIKRFGPRNSHYALLKRLLQKLQEQKENGEAWPPFQSSQVLKLGDSGNAVKDLCSVLIKQGYLEPEASTQTYDFAVESALRTFQIRNHLPVTGVVSAETQKALNVSLDQRIRQVVLNMERARWIPDTLPETRVWVNIPSYELEFYRDNILMGKFKTCVGEATSPTPQMHTTMYAVRFNPSWTIPRRIVRKKFIPLIQKDPDYLKNNGYLLLDIKTRVIVDRDSLDMADINLATFPFIIRQPPGRKNALGQIRFSLHNKRHIHIHDTQHKSLFAKNTRTFSAGCIRVQNPEKLAYLVLNTPDRWSPSVIAKLIDTDLLQDVTLPQPVPVYVVYHTIWFDDKGMEKFTSDVYKNDEKLDFALHTYESHSHNIDIRTLGTHKNSQEVAEKILEQGIPSNITETAAK